MMRLINIHKILKKKLPKILMIMTLVVMIFLLKNLIYSMMVKGFGGILSTGILLNSKRFRGKNN